MAGTGSGEIAAAARSGGRGPRRVAPFAALLLALLVPAAALGAFPGADPDESVRVNAPDDPGFDRCEPDNEGGQSCTNTFDQEFERFGFAPGGSQGSALYNPAALPARQSAQNAAAGRNPLAQVSGISADRAYKYFGEDDPGAPVGDPEVEVAILDTGIRWSNDELRTEIALNEGELPPPRDGSGDACGSDDCNGDGAFNVDDYAADGRVAITDGHAESDDRLDASDLLAAFSDGADDDGNGFADDIAGWDFFDDDNDPYDASSYSAASNHGTGRAEEAGAATDNGSGGTGVCPACQIVPIRVWDTFVVDTNNFALGVLYAADNGVEVVEGAVGGLSNTRFARETWEYAYRRGTLPVLVSSDLNTANHNYPTNYDQSLHVQGAVADVQGLGENPPDEFIDFFNQVGGIPLGSNAPIGTWFRNSGTTQYGGHAHLVTVAVTGSQATGQAAGAAALIESFGNRKGIDLAPNEIKQLMTMTTEDVKALNTGGLGTPDPAQNGWDQHFGYGRLDLGAAVEAVRDGEIPPQVLIKSPDWFAPLNAARQETVEVRAQISADRAPAVGGERYGWELQWAPGIEPCEADFESVAAGAGAGPLDGALGTLDLGEIRSVLDARTVSSSCGNVPGPVQGGGTVDPTAPTPGPGDVDPNEPAFTVRVVATDSEGNAGEDRKTLFAYSDDSLAEGWSRPIGGERDASGEADGGGESSHRLFDLDGDNRLEVIEATSSGELHVLRGNGTADPAFNGGEPVLAKPYPNVHGGAAGFASVDPPRESLRVPSIGDIDGDREPEVVVSGGEHVYAWESDGAVVDGFPFRIDPDHSRVEDRSRQNHVKRGFIASPALGDLDGDRGLEIVVPGLDQHLYAIDGDGTDLPGFPVYLRERDAAGDPIPCSSGFECAESINTAAIGDISGDGEPEIVAATAEFDDDPGAPAPPAGLGGFGGLLNNFLAQALGGSSRVYAVSAAGEILPGWPTKPAGIVPDALPLVGPGVDQVLGDADGDGTLDVIGNIATGDVTATRGDGSKAVDYDSEPQTGESSDRSKVLNLFENPVFANLDGAGGPEVLKGGISLLGLVNVGVAVGQNLPYSHLLQAWDAASGVSLPAYPQAVEDYQLLSSPAVADVSDAPGNEALVGTGLYLIRNLNSTGAEGSDWPKFTGGWSFAVPAVGDVEGDGDLEVAAQTREGFAFLWETGAEACGEGNQEWWTFRHDERSSGAYGTDARPPGAPERLRATRGPKGSIELSWKAPGDDWLCGEPDRYEVRISKRPIEAPEDGSRLRLGSAAAAAGEEASELITAKEIGRARYAAVLYRDEARNWGALASVELRGRGGCERVRRGSEEAGELSGDSSSERFLAAGGDDRVRGRRGGDCVNAAGGQR